MILAVCLLTADRAGYTADTLLSFLNHADRPEFIRLHADDGSVTQSNMRVAEGAGFTTVYASRERRGPMAALRAMWAEAQHAGATHILHLENDWEFTNRVPLGVAERVDCLRLYGRYKSRDGDRVLTGTNYMRTNTPIPWKPVPGGFERAPAHWAGPPSVTRAPLLLEAVRNARTFKDLSLSLLMLDTLRPLENIVWHIGTERTPEAKFNQ